MGISDLLILKYINASYNRKTDNFLTTHTICVPRHKMSLQVMEPPSEEVLEKVRGEFGLNEQRVRDAVEHLKDWIQLQPHLPQEIGTFFKTL